MARECRNQPNAQLVQHRLLERFQQPAGNASGSQLGTAGCPTSNYVPHAECSSPEWWRGTTRIDRKAPTTMVLLDGHKCEACWIVAHR